MNWHDLVFSDKAVHRLSRHVAFWIVAWIFFLSTYFFPMNCFPGWKLQGEHVLMYEKLGFIKFSLMNITFSSRNIVLQILFTYTIIYFLMPKYLIKEKYGLFATGIAVLLLIAAIIHYYLGYTQSFIYSIFGIIKKVPKRDFYSGSLSTILFYYPMVGGVALSIKLMKHWWLKQKEGLQLATSKSNAELQLLKAQVHPHFLFNTLNNIYSFILTSSTKAPEIVKKLSGLLHYIIYECNQPQVPVEKELKMIRDYISLETIRYGDQFDVAVDIRGDYSNKNIAALLLLPFVENSFKHGTSKMLTKPWVNLNIIIENEKIYFMLNNSKPEEYFNPTRNAGIGLQNVQKRLQLLYPARHELKMTSEPGHFTVLLEIDLQPVTEKVSFKKLKQRAPIHEMG